MEKLLNAKEEFNQKVKELQEDMQPALTDNNVKELVIYEKLLEIENKINKLSKDLKKNNS